MDHDLLMKCIRCREALVIPREVAGQPSHPVACTHCGDALWLGPAIGVRQEAPDKAVEAVRALLLRRSQVGLKKYGRSTDGLELLETLRHSLEEKLDDAVYMQHAIHWLERELDGGK